MSDQISRAGLTDKGDFAKDPHRRKDALRKHADWQGLATTTEDNQIQHEGFSLITLAF